MSAPAFNHIVVGGVLIRLSFEGDWNASTNSPALVSATGTAGQALRVGTAGSTTLDGESSWALDDYVIFDGTAWFKVTPEGSGAGGGSSISPLRIVQYAQMSNVADLAAGAPLTVDGATVQAGDRILVPAQTTASERGIYVVTTPGSGSDGTWTRATDFDNAVDDEVQAGVQVYVQSGSSYAQSRFTLVTAGTIVIGTTDLEFVLEGGLVRTDESSTEVIASTAFLNGTFEVSDLIDMRDHTHVAVFFDPTDIGTNSQVDIVVFWSDDGTTIPFATDDNIQQTDFDITNQSDGSFKPKPYTARLTTATSELATNKKAHLVFEKGGGACKIGVKGNAADGAYSVRTQRLTR